MWSHFKTISLTHGNAPVDVRERFHLSATQCRSFSEQLREILAPEEFLVLSTCNRTEVFYLSHTDLSENIVRLLCLEKGITDCGEWLKWFTSTPDHSSAVRHLFTVAMGLESSIAGDLQIAGQVKEAYSIAAELKTAGPFLHRLMHTIFHANKRVQQETEWRSGSASMSYAAAGLAQELASGKHEPSVLVVGAGEMGRDILLNLSGGAFRRMAVSNRTQSKAEDLAVKVNAQVVPFEDVASVAQTYDVIITAIPAPEPVFRAAHLSGKDRFEQKYFIDLSVPRCVDAAVAEIPGVLVFGVDEIQVQIDDALSRRQASIPAVESIISEEIENFHNWSREFTISPVIQRFKEALEQIRREELERYLKTADEAQMKMLDEVTKSMMNKIVKLPVLQLKAACLRGEEENLIGVLNDLFNLEKVKQD